MRSFLFATIAAFTFPACVQDIAGSGPGSGDTGGATCGNGTVDPGETCDDGNTTAGDGCSASCQTESGSSPRVTAMLDKTAISTALNKTEKIVLTVSSVDGYTGTVNVAVSSPDNAKVTVTAAYPSVTLTVGGTQTVEITAVVASDATGVAVTNNIKVELTGGDTETLTSALAIDNSFTVETPVGTSNTVSKHEFPGGAFTVIRGTKIHFINHDTTPGVAHITHGDGVLPHQTINATTGLLNDDYMVDTTADAPGSTGHLGCHNHEASGTYIAFTIM